MEWIDDEIILECTKRNGTKYTDLVEEIVNRTKKSPRLVKQRIKTLEERGIISKKKEKGYGFPVYVINVESQHTSHSLYMVGVKKDKFYSQKSISEIIALNESEYEFEIKGKTDEVYSYSASTLLSAFYWYQKISFALLSGFFGNSKVERALAISNKKRLEKLISKIYKNAIITDYELWHSLIHGIHDILDSHRKLSKEQLAKIWKY